MRGTPPGVAGQACEFYRNRPGLRACFSGRGEARDQAAAPRPGSRHMARHGSAVAAAAGGSTVAISRVLRELAPAAPHGLTGGKCALRRGECAAIDDALAPLQAGASDPGIVVLPPAAR